MMSLLQLNYDELSAIARQFRDEGEDLAQLHSNLIQRMQALHKDWIGEAADSFYAEMQENLIPALKRTCEALFLAEEATRKITSLVNQADEEISQRFQTEFGADFGASIFAQAGAGLREGAQPLPTVGETPEVGNSGTGVFEDTLPGGGVTSGEPLPPVEEGGSAGAGDAGAGTSEALPPQNDVAGGSSTPPSESGMEESTESEKESDSAEVAPASGGGGGGGSGDSSGAEDANSLGSGLGAQPTNQFNMVSGGESVMPENSYSGQSGGDAPEGKDSPPSGGGAEVSSSGASTAAGIIGAAAVGVAGKVIRDAIRSQPDSE